MHVVFRITQNHEASDRLLKQQSVSSSYLLLPRPDPVIVRLELPDPPTLVRRTSDVAKRLYVSVRDTDPTAVAIVVDALRLPRSPLAALDIRHVSDAHAVASAADSPVRPRGQYL